MIFSLILCAVGVIMLVLGIIMCKVDSYSITGGVLCILGVALILIIGMVMICVPLENDKELDTFLQQKAYLESYEPTSEYDLAAITSKKIELNTWLYEAQYIKEHRPAFSFYGDEILEIEPIK